MHYDTVEFVMDIEERFGIALPDVDAERICTMGDLCDYLANRARLFLNSPCPTATAFYKLRRAILDCLRPGASIRPDMKLSSIVPTDRRRDVWEAVGNRFHTTLPPFHWRWRLRIAYTLFIFLPLTACLLTVAHPRNNLAFVLIATIVLASAQIFGYAFTNRYANVIPAHICTVEDLSRWLTARCHLQTDKSHVDLAPWIWAEVSEIVCANMSVTPDTLTRDFDFVKELSKE